MGHSRVEYICAMDSGLDSESVTPSSPDLYALSQRMRVAHAVKNTFKRARRFLEPRLGLAVRRFPVVGSHARELRDTIRALAIDGIIDVGAHEGEFGQFVRNQVGFAGPIVSFEPYPEAFGVLEATAMVDSAWRVRNCALGRKSECAELTVYSTPQFNSLKKVNELGRDLFATHTEPQVSLCTEVARLDQLYEPNWGKRLFLKSDTQGSDLEVVQGATGIMELVQVIQVEAGVNPIYEGAPDVIDVIQYLRDFGFGPSSFHPVVRSQNSPITIEFDILFVRGLPEMQPQQPKAPIGGL